MLVIHFSLQAQSLVLEVNGKDVEGELHIIKALKEEFVINKTQLLMSINEVRHKLTRF